MLFFDLQKGHGRSYNSIKNVILIQSSLIALILDEPHETMQTVLDCRLFPLKKNYCGPININQLIITKLEAFCASRVVQVYVCFAEYRLTCSLYKYSVFQQKTYGFIKCIYKHLGIMSAVYKNYLFIDDFLSSQQPLILNSKNCFTTRAW